MPLVSRSKYLVESREQRRERGAVCVSSQTDEVRFSRHGHSAETRLRSHHVYAPVHRAGHLRGEEKCLDQSNAKCVIGGSFSGIGSEFPS